MDAAPNNQTPMDLDDGPPRRPSSPPQVHPLAPLEYLQNQRRGSITDPSLHASPPDPSLINHHHQPLNAEQRTKRSPRTLRPTSPFVFGDASLHPPDLSSPNIRRLLRSPSNENLETARTTADRADDSSRSLPPPGSPDRRVVHNESRPWITPEMPRESRSESSANMDIGQHDAIDSKHRSVHAHALAGPASTVLQAPDFDYNMRRHSIAEHPVPGRGVSHPPDIPHSTPRSPGIPSLPSSLKRKLSTERVLYTMGEEPEQSHQSTVPDLEGPTPKRRGSAFDPHRMAHLTLHDRRDSVDSRAQGQSPHWWMADRRDSTSSMFSNTSAGGYSSSGFSGESAYPSRQGLANVAWSHHPSNAGHNHEADMPISGLPRHLQTRAAGPGENSIPPFSPVASMSSDRRMSVPEVVTTGHPQRNLRSKSRPPAPHVAARNSERQTSTNPSEGDGIPEDSETSPTQTQMLQPGLKEGTSPYSRSPELRVSHKLAERKRRKEMKDLFDELRDQLPADRGMKASKWEILTKAVDHISTLKAQNQEMSREIDILRHELDVARSGSQYQPVPGSSHPVYGQGGVSVGSPYVHPPTLPQSQHPPHDSPSTT